jgi:hypothetical protein
MEDTLKPVAYALIDNGRFDMSPAERFGQVEFILDRDFSPYPSPANDRVEERLVDFLRRFRPDVDYLIPVGSPTTILRLGMMMRHAGIARCKVLHFEPRRLAYTPVEVQL